MTSLVWIGIGLAGGAGAVFRFLLDGRISARIKSAFPYGTLAVNLTGATMLGLVTGLTPTHQVTLIVGTGAVGGYTTFSTWMFESHRLAEDRQTQRALINVGVSLFAGLACTAAGYTVGGVL